MTLKRIERTKNLSSYAKSEKIWPLQNINQYCCTEAKMGNSQIKKSLQVLNLTNCNSLNFHEVERA